MFEVGLDVMVVLGKCMDMFDRLMSKPLAILEYSSRPTSDMAPNKLNLNTKRLCYDPLSKVTISNVPIHKQQ